MICKRIVYCKQCLKEPELICLHTIQWFHVLLTLRGECGKTNDRGNKEKIYISGVGWVL